jgi:hypothetical protein
MAVPQGKRIRWSEGISSGYFKRERKRLPKEMPWDGGDFHAISGLTEPTQLNELEIGSTLAALLNACDRVVVKSLNWETRKTETTTLADKTTPTRLAAVLGKASYQKKGPCKCISYPEYCFYRGDKLELRITVHHGKTLRTFGGPVTGDFALGEATIKEVVALLTTSK